MGFSQLREPTDCPVCKGPCKYPFERGPYQIGGHMPRVKDWSGDPEPEKPKRDKKRGRRAKKGPVEDRMRRKQEDRA